MGRPYLLGKSNDPLSIIHYSLMNLTPISPTLSILLFSDFSHEFCTLVTNLVKRVTLIDVII